MDLKLCLKEGVFLLKSFEVTLHNN